MGVGVDIVEIERFKNLTERWGEHFLKKIFTQREIDYCLSKKEQISAPCRKICSKRGDKQSNINWMEWNF